MGREVTLSGPCAGSSRTFDATAWPLRYGSLLPSLDSARASHPSASFWTPASSAASVSASWTGFPRAGCSSGQLSICSWAFWITRPGPFGSNSPFGSKARKPTGSGFARRMQRLPTARAGAILSPRAGLSNCDFRHHFELSAEFVIGPRSARSALAAPGNDDGD